MKSHVATINADELDPKQLHKVPNIYIRLANNSTTIFIALSRLVTSRIEDKFLFQLADFWTPVHPESQVNHRNG